MGTVHTSAENHNDSAKDVAGLPVVMKKLGFLVALKGRFCPSLLHSKIPQSAAWLICMVEYIQFKIFAQVGTGQMESFKDGF